MKCVKILKGKPFLLTMLLLLLMAAGVLAWMLVPEDAEGMRRSAAIVQTTTWHEVNVDGKPLLYFRSTRGDSALVGVTHRRDSAVHRRYAAGCWLKGAWPFSTCDGRIATVDRAERSVRLRKNADVRKMCLDAVEQELKVLKGQNAELDYYLRVHGVQDNGYQQIAALAQQVRRDYEERLRAKAILDSVGAKARFCVATSCSYKALYRDENGKLRSVRCRFVAAVRQPDIVMLATADGVTPVGAEPMRLLPWRHRGGGAIRVAGFGGLGVSGLECDTVSARIVAGHATKYGRHDIPAVLASGGSPVFTAHGRFIGITVGDETADRAVLRKLTEKEGNLWR